eukprot:TRINITY_DN3914_c0_g1_i1.p1 TRINITY_DN3914_c0_g1~~TRINITY_DN3914_c0_g1_i1.p1  ORF type:complete len:199 (-),score=34.32 TRINITY_DN3914_c0_g1_i1:161-709(-)
MSYRFSSDPPTSLIQDLTKLSQFDPEQLGEFTRITLVFLVSSDAGKLLESAETFSSNVGIRLEIVKELLKSYLIFFKGAFKNNLTSSQLSEDLVMLGLTQNHIAQVTRIWVQSLRAIGSGSLSQTLMVNQLVLPQWRFGITASNKDLRNVGSTFLQLKLVLDKGSGQLDEEFLGMLSYIKTI